MESLFIYELIKTMRGTSDISSGGAFGSATYTSMFDMEIARVLSERGLGLRDMIERGLNNHQNYARGVGYHMNRLPKTGANASDAAAGVLALDEEEKISSGFGLRHDPFTGKVKFHRGVDIAVPEGTEIRPIRRGRVVFSGEQEGYGNVVIIDHGDGLTTKYTHNEATLVKEGDVVDASTVIARVGSTGRSTGPHIHFEARYGGESIDPMPLLAKKRDSD